jgi:hypothetical protein
VRGPAGDAALLLLTASCARQVGAVIGLGAASYVLQNESGAKPVHFLGAAGVGAAGGVLVHILTRPQGHKTPNKMVHELRH